MNNFPISRKTSSLSPTKLDQILSLIALHSPKKTNFTKDIVLFSFLFSATKQKMVVKAYIPRGTWLIGGAERSISGPVRTEQRRHFDDRTARTGRRRGWQRSSHALHCVSVLLELYGPIPRRHCWTPKTKKTHTNERVRSQSNALNPIRSKSRLKNVWGFDSQGFW